jgi:hypothetical protein
MHASGLFLKFVVQGILEALVVAASRRSGASSESLMKQKARFCHQSPKLNFYKHLTGYLVFDTAVNICSASLVLGVSFHLISQKSGQQPQTMEAGGQTATRLHKASTFWVW